MAATVGLISAGAMGAAVGAGLVAAGHRVLWASDGRSPPTRARAVAAGLDDVGDERTLFAEAPTLLSICPPHVAPEVAGRAAAAGFAGTYVDANAVAPQTATAIAAAVAPARYVDGGIIGGPPRERGSTRLYLAGPGAAEVASLFAGNPLEAVVVAGEVPAASALKVAYASWTKGSAALLLATRTFAAVSGVEAELVAEWERSQPDLPDRCAAAAESVAPKAWRFVGEMEQIAAALRGAGLPDGFHLAAAEVYRRLSDG